MPNNWALQDAKARFSEVVRKATTDGPQIVTYRGVEKAVVLSAEDYRKLKAQKPSFVDVLLNGPKFDDETIDLINRRSRDQGRKVEL
ncbi:MAG: type II toxin-antitoxin system Phd/YefM family antitoxin [Enhydrobacter sp.]|nr:type II toxin-antitoxin system Phd/YefM family antitoxin [Enhydrobacter sp.]